MTKKRDYGCLKCMFATFFSFVLIQCVIQKKVCWIEAVSDGGGRRWMRWIQWTLCLLVNDDLFRGQNLNIDPAPVPCPEANGIFELRTVLASFPRPRVAFGKQFYSKTPSQKIFFFSRHIYVRRCHICLEPLRGNIIFLKRMKLF